MITPDTADKPAIPRQVITQCVKHTLTCGVVILAVDVDVTTITAMTTKSSDESTYDLGTHRINVELSLTLTSAISLEVKLVALLPVPTAIRCTTR